MKKIAIILFLLSAITITAYASNAVPIVFENNASSSYTGLSTSDLKKIVYLGLQQAHKDTHEFDLYSHAVATLHSSRINCYIIVTLYYIGINKISYVKIDLNKKFQIAKIINHYHPLLKTNIKDIGSPSVCPDQSTEFLIAEPLTSGNRPQSVSNAVNQIYPEAVTKYQKDHVKLLLGKEDTVQNFEDYLTCPNLKGVFSIASHDDQGRSFMLYDGDFQYQFLQDNPALNYDHAIISFDTCYAYNAAQPGLCTSMKLLHTEHYTAGVTPLPFVGSPSTYACFWKQILMHNAQPTKTLLSACAKENDPFVKGSNSPLYIIAPQEFNSHGAYFYPAVVHTNLHTYSISRKQQYASLNLQKNEYVDSVKAIIGNQTVTCSTNKKLFNQPGLRAHEFLVHYDIATGQCTITQLSRKRIFPSTGGYDQYGISPYDTCGHG